MKVFPFLRLRTFVFILAGLCILGGLCWFAYTRTVPAPTYSEVAELNQVSWTFQEYSDYFQKLAEGKGAPYAYEVMRRAQFPVGISLHLIAHVVGAVLYKQEGVNAMKECTPDFRDACSHAVVTSVLSEYGVGALSDIVATCKQAPGAKGAYAMCFHGLGHGVLTFNNYDFAKAVAMCEKVGTPALNSIEYTECVGGASMEMVSGIHDRIAWEKQRPYFFKESDPLSLCTASFMPEAARPICLNYLTPHLMKSAGIDLNNLNSDLFPKALAFCTGLPVGSRDRDSCYAGFGKEFPAMSGERYVIDLGTLTPDQLKKVSAWCATPNDVAGSRSCNRGALSSLVWGGANSLDASFTFCSLVSEETKDDCYKNLSKDIVKYLSGTNKMTAACSRLPEAYRGSCVSVH